MVTTTRRSSVVQKFIEKARTDKSLAISEFLIQTGPPKEGRPMAHGQEFHYLLLHAAVELANLEELERCMHLILTS
jgi:translation initiation factor 2B subunit (eIF-2B alpha/beta/delta family)